MLGLNQLIGFGAGGSRGEMSVNYLASVADIDPLNTFVEVTPISITAGRLLVMAAAGDNSGGAGASAWDGFGPLSNSQKFDTVQDPGADDAGVSMAVATGTVLATNASYTLGAYFVDTFVVNSKVALAIEAWSATGTPVYVSSDSNAGNGTTPSVSATLEPGDLMIGFIAQEARTAPTADGASGWGAQTGDIADTTVAGTSIALHTQNRIATTGGSHTYAPTLSAARDYVIGCIVIRAPF